MWTVCFHVLPFNATRAGCYISRKKGPNMTTISSRYQVCILTNSVCNACYVLLCAGVWLQSVAGCTWGEARPRTLTGGCLLYCVLLPVLYCHRQEKVASRTCAWCQESGEERELLQFSSERAPEAWGSLNWGTRHNYKWTPRRTESQYFKSQSSECESTVVRAQCFK